jgi:LysR family transcriptional regulator, glycine cleavage system transcriptional activator
MDRHSLSLLATFEVAARHQSFARAAEELSVTPAAVSQQIRLLEARLGVPLFVRGQRSLRLTAVGRDYALQVRGGLDAIRSATRILSAPRAEGVLRVATFHSFGIFWLIPRLPEFRALYPDVDVRLVLGNPRIDLREGDADIAIRFGTDDDGGCESVDLIRDTAIAVVSPDLLAGRSLPREPTALVGFPLLHDEGVAAGEPNLLWQHWGTAPSCSAGDIYLPDGLTVVHACLLGQGAAIVRASLVDPLMRAGRLVRLIGRQKTLKLPYRLVTVPGDARVRVRVFSDWLAASIGSGGSP